MENNLPFTSGRGSGLFAPTGNCKREEFVQILFNCEGKPAYSVNNPFFDVVDSGWYKPAVLWAYENNMTKGVSNTQFGVGLLVTRQQMAQFLYNYAGKCG